RVGDAALEPAVRPCADAPEDRTARPRLPQGTVDAVESPEGERVGGVAARDVDHVLPGEMLRRALGGAEQAQAARLAVPTREGLEEGRDRRVPVAGGRRYEADSRPSRRGQREEEVVQQQALLHHEAAATHGKDLAWHARECRFPRKCATSSTST